MSDQFELIAEVRTDLGKGASRRLRRFEGRVPAIIYGGDKAPQSLSLISKDLEKSLENEAFYSHVLAIKIGDATEKAILKDMQRHPSKNRITHVDFMRVDDNVAIKVHVPIHFLNEETCYGVKTQGGMIQHQETDIEVQCLPADIPTFIEVDMLKVETGQIVHLSDVTLPAGVTSVALALGEDHDLAIASVIAPKGGDDEADEAEADVDTAADAGEGDSED
ncbi:MAG: 50S ribosomal protein L25/general stress protein Ctc [Halioglobus sp.]|nr:50S ribosomal protein L25/general stress protein Ctc [Halioglobus sp.]